MKPCKRLQNIYTIIAAHNNKMQMILVTKMFSIIMNNGQQLPVMLARQPLIKFVHQINALFSSKIVEMPSCAIDCFSQFFIFSMEFHLAATFVYIIVYIL